MTAFSLALRQQFRSDAANIHAARTRSVNLTFLQWADCVEKLFVAVRQVV